MTALQVIHCYLVYCWNIHNPSVNSLGFGLATIVLSSWFSHESVAALGFCSSFLPYYRSNTKHRKLENPKFVFCELYNWNCKTGSISKVHRDSVMVVGMMQAVYSQQSSVCEVIIWRNPPPLSQLLNHASSWNSCEEHEVTAQTTGRHVQHRPLLVGVQKMWRT